jgi:hypothetical protein
MAGEVNHELHLLDRGRSRRQKVEGPGRIKYSTAPCSCHSSAIRPLGHNRSFGLCGVPQPCLYLNPSIISASKWCRD